MSNLGNYLKTVCIHRKHVRKMCWKMGLFWQGLVHDLSKYSIKEARISKYYGKGKSPHQWCREQIGYSPSWLHHYHKNKHHWEYWLDDDENGVFIPIKMPYKYVIESFCDMVGASKAYALTKWEPKMPIDYWNAKCEGKRIMHEDSKKLLVDLLTRLSDYGETNFLKWYKTNRKRLERNY